MKTIPTMNCSIPTNDFTPHEPFNAGHYGPYRVFDLREDPTESVNLYWQNKEVEGQLRRLLDSYREAGRSRR